MAPHRINKQRPDPFFALGHLKSDYRLERNRLKGGMGDALNVLLSAAAMNFAKLLRFVLAFWRLLLAAFFRPTPSPCFA
jgi:IS5 family transposase